MLITHPMFSDLDRPIPEASYDLPFRERMIAYIRSRYGRTLGADARLLDDPDGLEKLLAIVQQKLAEKKIA